MNKTPFVNPHSSSLRRTIWDAILWKTGYYKDSSESLSPPLNFSYPAEPMPFTEKEPSAVWIGHSTFLIQVDGLTLLTDPVWDRYCSPVPIKALRRYTEPPMELSDLPPIDLVLLSHNHYDHLDAKTVMTLTRRHPQIQWLIPERLSPWFKRRKIDAIRELARWESVEVKNSKITAVPAQHFSGRTLWDKNRTHWNGYVVETPTKKLYFVGDTGYNPVDFKAIGEKFGSFDLSLIPIGSYAPREFMSPVHVCPSEAVQIHREVNSRLSLGMHWNTFRLSDESHDRPPYDLYLAMEEAKLSFGTFLPIDIGTYVNF